MKKVFNLTIVAIIAVAMTSCSDGSNVKQDMGNGPLAPLAEKYLEMAANQQESEEALADLKDTADKEDALKTAEKAGNELSAKNAALLEEAKAIAEQLKGKAIPCSATEATGLTQVSCTVDAAKAVTSSATVTLVFKVEPATDQTIGCLFQDASGQTLAKLTALNNGDGTMGVIYMFGTKNNGENALIASEIEKIELVSAQEYEAAAIVSDKK